MTIIMTIRRLFKPIIKRNQWQPDELYVRYIIHLSTSFFKDHILIVCRYAILGTSKEKNYFLERKLLLDVRLNEFKLELLTSVCTISLQEYLRLR